MARCPTHGFENCPYHGGNARTPVGAFRFCSCFANHDGRTACECACGQCEVYREELAAGPVAAPIAEDTRVPVFHPADACAELCAPRDRWVTQLGEIETPAAAAAIRELKEASSDLAIGAALDKAELVYFGELDRLSKQRAVTPPSSKQRRKKKSERGKPIEKCALCNVTHAPSFHLAARKAGGDAEDALREAMDLLRRPGADEGSEPAGRG